MYKLIADIVEEEEEINNLNIVKKDWFSFLGKPSTVCLWTGNTTITPRGSAVMGAGLAKEIAKRYPKVKEVISKKILETPVVSTHNKDRYGNLCNFHDPKVLFINRKIGMFPVKYGWWQKAETNLIKRSAQQLNEKALLHDDYTFVVNFPGIGAGGLSYEEVLTILKTELYAQNIIITIK